MAKRSDNIRKTKNKIKINQNKAEKHTVQKDLTSNSSCSVHPRYSSHQSYIKQLTLPPPQFQRLHFLSKLFFLNLECKVYHSHSFN